MSNIIEEKITLPGDQKNKLAFALHNVFTPKECKEYIKKTEKKGYDAALVNIGSGRQLLYTDVRQGDRCIWDSVEEANKIWSRIKSFVCTEWKGHPVLGLNERLRFLRYDKGGYFKPHYDGCYMRENGEKSFITIQLYLNEGFKGGSTTFLHENNNEYERVEFVPKTGSVLIFQHDILHEGSDIIDGRKYTMRTDIMFGHTTQSPALPDLSKVKLDD